MGTDIHMFVERRRETDEELRARIRPLADNVFAAFKPGGIYWGDETEASVLP